jgi:hypothetical protein
LELEAIFNLQKKLLNEQDGRIWIAPKPPQTANLEEFEKQDPLSFKQLEFVTIYRYCEKQKSFHPSPAEIQKARQRLSKPKNFSNSRYENLIKQILTVERFQKARGGLLNNPILVDKSL